MTEALSSNLDQWFLPLIDHNASRFKMASLLMNRLIPEDRNRAAERIREIRGKTMSGGRGYNVIIFKQKNRQYSKMLKNTSNRGPYSLHSPRF